MRIKVQNPQAPIKIRGSSHLKKNINHHQQIGIQRSQTRVVSIQEAYMLVAPTPTVVNTTEERLFGIRSGEPSQGPHYPWACDEMMQHGIWVDKSACPNWEAKTKRKQSPRALQSHVPSALNLPLSLTLEFSATS